MAFYEPYLADIVFAAAVAVKLLPVLDAPGWIWIWTAVIAAIKVINIVSGFLVHKQFVSIHFIANKVTGVVLFILPLTLPVVEVRYSAAVVCALTTFAAIQEGHFIRSGRNPHLLR